MDDDNGGGGIPEWVLTFGDMMSLLLTFFIMLVSNERNEKGRRIQSARSNHATALRPKKPRFWNVPTHQKRVERSKRCRCRSPMGDTDRVRIVRQGKQSAIGTVIFFPNGELELDEKGSCGSRCSGWSVSRHAAETGNPWSTSHEMAAQTGSAVESYDLAYERSKAVMALFDDNTKYLQIESESYLPAPLNRCTKAPPRKPK